ncbi:protein kinase [Streptacidiphilus sp. N1-12]|uniref:Protein kinase n=2 Tax=Streptacidiphilus alkalitolerans TaxID=3342712 RepID=A0ABV6V9A7_9ACTN
MTEQGATGQGDEGAGRTVGHGRYLLRDLLGQGGMATVHLADDTVLDRPVAVKSMLGDMSREPSFRERFRREAQAVARLNHTNIVAVYDSGEDVNDDGVHVPFIVMEYVEGGSLSSVLRDDIAAHGAMPTDKALKITADVLAALAASHEQGLVHRDIKPANVMLTRRGVVKVMDFGIARAMQSGVTSMTQTGMVVGTPQYLSPEQALGKAVDARSDLYSVGCLLFELLTGRLPFESDSALGMAYQHVQETPPPPSSFNAAVPPGVDALVAQALRKDPAHRFQDADAMREECERLAGTGGTGANTPLIIGGGPRVGVGGSGANAVFPAAQGQLGTMPPQQPYQQQPLGTPYPQQQGMRTPQPYAPQGTPPPGPQGAPRPPYPQQQHPQQRPGMPGPQRTPPPGPQGGPRPPYPQAQRPGVPTPPPAPYRQPQGRPTPRPTPPPMPTPPPQLRPTGQMPQAAPRPYVGPQGARPGARNSGKGCGTALVITGVIVGLLVVIVLILVLVVENNTSSSDNTNYNGSAGAGPVATGLG